MLTNLLRMVFASVFQNTACFFCFILEQTCWSSESGHVRVWTYNNDKGERKACLGLPRRNKSKWIQWESGGDRTSQRSLGKKNLRWPPAPNVSVEREQTFQEQMPTVGGWGLGKDHHWEETDPVLCPWCLKISPGVSHSEQGLVQPSLLFPPFLSECSRTESPATCEKS